VERTRLVGLLALLLMLLSSSAVPFAAESPHAIHVPNAQHSLLLGGAIKDSKIWVVGERGHILISEDRGKNWNQADSVPTRQTLTSTFFHNKSIGWAVGHQAVILRTDDGGKNWQEVFSAPKLDQPLLDVWFKDANYGIAVGAYGYFLETNDGGSTWNHRYISEDDWHLNGIDQTGNGNLFIAAESGKVYRSEDDGQTWTSLPTPYEGSFHGLVPLGDESLIIFGLRGHVFRSDDNGDSWKQVNSGVKTLLTGGTTTIDGRLVLCGVSGTVLISNENITEFTRLDLPDRRVLAGVLSDDTSLVVLGEAGTLVLPLDSTGNVQ
jgi:photosystem II stability/assembly factor-like uncharacterized protein